MCALREQQTRCLTPSLREVRTRWSRHPAQDLCLRKEVLSTTVDYSPSSADSSFADGILYRLHFSQRALRESPRIFDAVVRLPSTRSNTETIYSRSNCSRAAASEVRRCVDGFCPPESPSLQNPQDSWGIPPIKGQDWNPQRSDGWIASRSLPNATARSTMFSNSRTFPGNE